jgi:nitroreductase
MNKQSERQSLSVIKTQISEEALDQLFREARTHSAWLAEPVPVELLRKVYELASLGPTIANGSPARFVFLTNPAQRRGSSRFWHLAMSKKPWPLL